ncbi:MAG: hypothetical protein J6B10_10150 [Lachnospiraceae bacterium]|nr:hypothetical protein [Lachnospiraceae bacterium]
MLGKLTKFEFRAVNKVLLLINAFTVLLTLIGCLTFASPLWDFESAYTGVLAMSSILIYYIAIIAISLFCCVYLAVRFYKNLYTDEGYLMHTLPVTPRELILSKTIAAFCWLLITGLLICFSVCAILGSAYLKFGVEEFEDISNVFFALNDFTKEVYDMSLTGFCIFMIVAMVVGSFSSIFMIYAAISVGQLMHKHKVLGSICCYIGFYFIQQTLSMITMIPYWVKIFTLDFPEDGLGSYMKYQLTISIILSAVLAVIYYIITEYMMKKKLNLD